MSSSQEITKKILSAHASTRERLEYLNDFVATIQKITAGDQKIVDIGAGVFPLALPLSEMGIQSYLAVESQKESVALLELYQKTLPQGLLQIFPNSFEHAVWSEYVGKNGMFDSALMLKLVSVVRRRDRALYSRLAEVPARKFVVSVPKESLTKNESIMRKEIAKVKEFSQLAHKKIIEKYDFPTEIVYVLN